MDAFERFGLLINDHVVRTPVAIASMAGIVDADYVLERKHHIGAAFIGGYSIDDATITAARSIAECGERKEFLPEDPVSELALQMEKMKGSDVVLGLNLRGSSPESYRSVAESLGDTVVYEIDAHCRQAPMVAAGCGEHYLKNPGDLVSVIRALKDTGVTVSVKIRVGVSPDDRRLARKIWSAGADILHIDLMDAGSAKLRQIRNSCPLMLIANNSINTFDAMRTGSPMAPISSRLPANPTSGRLPGSMRQSRGTRTSRAGTTRPSSSAAAGTYGRSHSAACRSRNARSSPR